MGFISKFENKMEDGLEGFGEKIFDAHINPVQISKKAEKMMYREKLVGAGVQYAPTLYTVLVNPDDDFRLFGYYPTLAGETQTYLKAKAISAGLTMDGTPLVRFVIDDTLKKGRFNIIAEVVAGVIVNQLRDEEMQRYGISTGRGGNAYVVQGNPNDYSQEVQRDEFIDQLDVQNNILPDVPDEEIRYSLDFGEYGFNSMDFYNESKALQDAKACEQPANPRDGLQGLPSLNEEVAGAAAGAGAGASAAAAVDAGAAAGEMAGAAVAAGVMAQPKTLVFNQDNSPAKRCLARLYNLATGELIELSKANNLAGRDLSCDICIDDPSASRSHAKIVLEPNGNWSIYDLNSTNGTFVDGQKITAMPLQSQDRITIGNASFSFEVSL